MFRLLKLLLRVFHRCLRSRKELLLENLVLRQQLAVLKQRNRRPKLRRFDKLFWIVIQRVWRGWQKSLLIVSPDTVVRWHREGFRQFWCWRSRHEAGRKRICKEIRELILQMASENPTWGAPRIRGELLKLGFDVSERTASRSMRRAPKKRDQSRQWKAFLTNHRDVIAAMDFLTVPTLSFSVLYCFFVIAHDRRRILHFNVTKHPSSSWIAQQLREAFPPAHSHRFLIFDRDAKFGSEVLSATEAIELAEQTNLRVCALHA